MVKETQAVVEVIANNNKKVVDTCSCDFPHSFSQLGELISLDAKMEPSSSGEFCIGLVNYMKNEESMLGAVRCASVNNSCVGIDVSKCEIRSLSSSTMNNNESLLTNLKNVFK